MSKSFTKDGDAYTISPIEGSNRFAVIKNNRSVKYTENSLLYKFFDKEDYQNEIIKLF